MSIDTDLTGLSEQDYGTNYRSHVLDIYKTYLQMADKISDRRQAANSFFLTLNSALVALISYVDVSTGTAPSTTSFFWLVALCGMVLAFLWYRLIRSYKDINSGKFKVVHAIEKLLPLHPFDAEWTALGKGADPKLYLPFTHIEIYIPWIFFIIHLFVLIKSFI